MTTPLYITGCAAWRIGIRRNVGSTGVTIRSWPSADTLRSTRFVNIPDVHTAHNILPDEPRTWIQRRHRLHFQDGSCKWCMRRQFASQKQSRDTLSLCLSTPATPTQNGRTCPRVRKSQEALDPCNIIRLCLLMWFEVRAQSVHEVYRLISMHNSRSTSKYQSEVSQCVYSFQIVASGVS